MYSLTWALQYVNLFMINTGYIILAGQALKVRYATPTIISILLLKLLKYILNLHLVILL